MVKSIVLASVSLVALASAAYLPLDGASSEGKSEGKCCAGAGSKATSTASSCSDCPTTAKLNQTQACSSEGCQGTRATSCCAEQNVTACSANSTACEASLAACSATGSACATGGTQNAAITSCSAASEGCSSVKATSAPAACPTSGGACAATTSCSAAGEGCSSVKATSAPAACGASGCATSCTAATACAANESGDCEGCPIAAAMAKLPQMTYLVGAEKSSCPQAAQEMAQKSDAKIQYVVGDKTFADEGQAKAALVEATEQFVAEFAQAKVCKESGQVSVAGQSLCCPNAAAAVAKTAADAMDQVRMTYTVGAKECACPKEAERLAQESGDIRLCVVGDQKTACPLTARLNLARAKYLAAVRATMQPQG